MVRELPFRIVVEDDGSVVIKRFEKNTSQSFRKAAQSGQRSSSRLKRSFDRIRRAARRVSAGLSSFVGGLTSLKTLVLAFVGGAVIGRLIRGFRSVINAATQQEDAIVQLNNALRVAGIFSKRLSEQAQDLASSLQAQTRFGDEAIIAMQSLLVTYGVTADKLEEATKASLDFASATGKDLTTAALTVGKAAAGFTGELSRYGIIVKTEGLPVTEVFTAVLAKMNQQFGGRAQADVLTFSGRTSQLGNALGDVQEIIGRMITSSEKLNVAFGEFVVGILAAVEAVNDLESADIGDLIAAFIPAAETAVTVIIRLVAGISALVFAFKAVQLGIIGFLRTVLRVIETLSELAGNVPGLEKALGGLNEKTRILAQTIGAGLDVETLILMDDMKKLERQMVQLLLAEEKGIAAAKKAVAALRERNKETRAFVKFQEALAVLNRAATVDELERAAFRADAARQIFEVLRNERQEREAAVAANMKLVGDEQAMNFARVQQFLEGIDAIRQVLRDNESFLDELGQSRIDRISEEVRANVVGNEAIAKAFEDRIRKEIALDKLKRKTLEQGAAALSISLLSFAQDGGGKLFKIAKTFAVAEAAIAGLLATQRALASPPGPPFTIPLAAAIAVQTVSRVRQIAALQPGGGGGGGGGVAAPGGGGGAAPAAPAEPVVPEEPERGQIVNISVAGFVGEPAVLASELGRVFREAVGDGVRFNLETAR